MQSIYDKVLTRIQRKGRGSSFSGKDFLDLATRSSVDKALSILSSSGTIRRVCRGIYDYPRFNEKLGGELSPDYDQVAHAVARRNGVRIEASGAWAANRLGLSTQVPAKIIYLTNGTSRDYKVGNQTVEFRRVGPKKLLAKKGPATLVVQALSHLGKKHVDEKVIELLRSRLPEKERRALLKDARYTTDWIYEVIKKIACNGASKNG
jgi:hypothetical protein